MEKFLKVHLHCKAWQNRELVNTGVPDSVEVKNISPVVHIGHTGHDFEKEIFADLKFFLQRNIQTMIIREMSTVSFFAVYDTEIWIAVQYISINSIEQIILSIESLCQRKRET